MTTTLSDTNTSPLGTLTFDPEPDFIITNYQRNPKDGIDVFPIAESTVTQYLDLKSSSIKYSLMGAILSQTVKDLLEEYFIKQNKTGFRLTIPRNQSSGTAPFNTTYRTIWIESISLNDVGGTQKPYWIYTIIFTLGEAVV